MEYIDYFNNTSNNFVDPGFKNCYGANDTTSYLVFEDGNADIINNGNILSSLNLNDIKFPLTQFVKETKYINPDSYIILGDLTKGLAFRQQYFQLPNYASSDLEYKVNLKFEISFFKNFLWETKEFIISPDKKTYTSVIDVINSLFKDNNINVTANIESEYLVFKGNNSGYSFNVFNMFIGIEGLDEWFELNEDISKSVDSIKYINGSCKGIVAKFTYPKYNNENIEEYDKFILYKSIPDTVDIYMPYTFDPSCQIDSSCFDPSIMQFYTKESYNVLINNACGEDFMPMNKYMNYLTTNNLWDSTGVFFSNLATENNENNNSKLSVRSMIFYNPHYFPVKVDYLIVA